MQIYESIESLDEDTQRRVILQAVKKAYPSALNQFKRKLPTLRELDSDYYTVLWVLAIAGIFAFFPWLAIPFATAPLRRVRQTVRSDWRSLQANPDSECE